jgi:hypothetical protein
MGVDEMDALELVLPVFDEVVLESDLEHPTKNAAANPSAKIGFNVFNGNLLQKMYGGVPSGEGC